MNKVVAYINANVVCPSGYYRVVQYFKNDSDFATRPLMPIWVYTHWHRQSALLHKLFAPLVLLLIICRVTAHLTRDLINIKRGVTQCVIIQRTICPKYMPFFTYLLLKKVAQSANKLIWDFDDNIIENRAISVKEKELLCKYASTIIVTSEFLRDKLPAKYHDKVMFLPTTDGDMIDVDRRELADARTGTFDKELRILWVGTGSGNLGFVKRIVPQLEETAKLMQSRYGRATTLTIVSNIALEMQTQHLKIRNITWTHDEAIREILSNHIGIMPLQTTYYTLGKGGFKLIQYMSASLPVVASAVGYNTKVVTPDCGILLNDTDDLQGWELTRYAFATNKDEYKKMCDGAFARYNERFSYAYNKKQWDLLCNN